MQIGDSVKIANEMGEVGINIGIVLDIKEDAGQRIYQIQTMQGKLWILEDRVRKL